MKKLLLLLMLPAFVLSCRGPLARQDSYPTSKNTGTQMPVPMMKSSRPANVSITREEIKIEPCNGCITIAELFSNKTSYSGKSVRIKGKITKINPAIMGKNWVHIQDGTEAEGSFDLTVTTDLELQVGEVVTFEGKIVLDKDFGYGYRYNILLEDGKTVID